MEAGPSQQLTIVVSTSSSRLAAAEQLGHTRQVLQSLHDFAPDARKILIVDALPSQGEVAALCQSSEGERDTAKWREAWRQTEDFKIYCDALRAAASSSSSSSSSSSADDACWQCVELIFLGSHGHLVGGVRHAFEMINTEVALVTQHDLVLDAAAVGQARASLEHALRDGGVANYVGLDRDTHDSYRTQSYWHFEPELDVQLHAPKGGGEPTTTTLAAVVGFSDQAHFVNVAWYKQRVLGSIPSTRKTCMEHVVDELMCTSYNQGGDHERTYLLRALHDPRPPVLRDLVHGQLGRTAWLAPPHHDSEWREMYDQMEAMKQKDKKVASSTATAGGKGR